MVGRAGERQLLLERALQKASQLFLVRQQDGKVKQAGGVRRPLLAVLEGGEAKDRRVTGAEDWLPAVATQACKAKALVEIGLSFQIEDLELDGAERPRGALQYQYVGPSDLDEPGASTASPFGPASRRTIASILAV